jgi:hypothetical protein
MKITVHERCDNAPKKAFLRDFVVAVANGGDAAIGDNVTEDVRWEMLGRERWDGRHQVLAELRKFGGPGLAELIINVIVTHGYDGAVDGLLVFEDGRKLAFCHIVTFRASTNNAPVKAIRTYQAAIE